MFRMSQDDHSSQAWARFRIPPGPSLTWQLTWFAPSGDRIQVRSASRRGMSPQVRTGDPKACVGGLTARHGGVTWGESSRPAQECGTVQRREPCTSLFANRLRPSRRRDADVRLRRLDRGPRPARHLRRAPLLRPVRRALRASHRAARLGGRPARRRLRSSRPSGDDLEALANAVREAARPQQRAAEAGGGARSADPMEVARRGHLRVLRSPDN